ncbi:MAG: archease [Candidatus Wallbacteria bacterium]|nr:archease [Candidatus Wallbacteria bacterium]
MPFEYLDHSSDVKIRACGKSLEESFSSAAYALSALVYDPKAVSPVRSISVRLHTTRLKSLLFDFLQTLIVRFESEAFLLHDVKELRIFSRYELEAILRGDDAGNYECSSGAKAVTYSEMEINDDYTVTVVVDV